MNIECNVENKEENKIKVEWYLKGKELENGYSLKMKCEFGFVKMNLNDVYESDKGI
jgi:hypothetical protein